MSSSLLVLISLILVHGKYQGYVWFLKYLKESVKGKKIGKKIEKVKKKFKLNKLFLFVFKNLFLFLYFSSNFLRIKHILKSF